MAAQKVPTNAPAGASVPNPGIAQVPARRPDLLVESIEFKSYKLETLPDGTRSGSFLPKYTIRNAGSAASGEFKFTWEYWDYGTGTWRFWLYTPSPLTCDNLAAGVSYSQGGQMADQFGFTVPAGSNAWPKFRVKLDTLNQVTESNELNNEKVREATPIAAGAVPATPVLPKIK